MTACQLFSMKNFRLWTEFKNRGELSINRYKKLNGYFHGKLLFNLYLDDTLNYIFNIVRRGKIDLNPVATLTAINDNYNFFKLTAGFTSPPTYTNLDTFDNVNLCNSEESKLNQKDPCICK